MDYGQFYSARTIADASNTGRRLVYGNVRTDVTQMHTHQTICRNATLDLLACSVTRPSRTQGPFGVNTTVCEAKPWSSTTQACPVWFFFALPRELSLSDDDRLLVKPPKELDQLRTGSAVTKTVAALKCGQRMALGLSSQLAEVDLTLRWAATDAAAAASGWQQAGIYVLDGGVSVGYEPSTERLILNASNSTVPPAGWGNASRFQASPSAVNVSTGLSIVTSFPSIFLHFYLISLHSYLISLDFSPVNNSVAFRVYLDKIVVEVFEERGRAAITQVTAPIAVGASAEVSFQWKNPDFLFKNPDFLLKRLMV